MTTPPPRGLSDWFRQPIEYLKILRLDLKEPPPLLLQPSWNDQQREQLALLAVEKARAEIGHGESGRNNCGPDIARYCHPHGDGHNWCGGLVCYCFSCAADDLEWPLPFQRSLGAKRLGKNIAEFGHRFYDPALAKPGDVMVFHRGPQGSWMGHIEIIEHNDDPRGFQHTIPGNSSAKVRRAVRNVHDARLRFAFFASVRLPP